MRALIVEDESPTSNLLQLLLTEIDPDIELIGCASETEEAIRYLKERHPDLVLMDIMVPGGTGFDILDAVPDYNGAVIFITAHDHFMLQALQHAAVGFVLKPIRKDDLQQALRQAKKRLNIHSQRGDIDRLVEAIHSNPFRRDQRIAIPSDAGFVFLLSEDIVRCEGLKTYTWIYMKDGQKLLSSYNLGEFRKILSEVAFCQVHKSHIISLRAVRGFDSKSNLITLSDKSQVPLARRARASFLKHFKIPNR